MQRHWSTLTLSEWSRDWPTVARQRAATVSMQGDAFRNTVAYLFFHCKRGVCVVGNASGLCLVVVVDNTRFVNNWPPVRTQSGASAVEFCRGLGCDARPVKSWSTNGTLVDNWRSTAPWSGGACLADALQIVDESMRHCGKEVECVLNCRDAPLLHGKLGAGRGPLDATRRGAPWMQVAQCRGHGGVQSWRFLRVLSQYSTPDYADATIPLLRSWVQDRQAVEYDTAPASWSSREPRAIFRGSATTHFGGECQRVRVARMGLTRADIGITGTGNRFRFGRDGRLYGPVDVPSACRAAPMSMQEQHRRYRWALYIAGNSGADRLMELLRARFTVIVVESDAPQPHLLLYDIAKHRQHILRTTEAELQNTLHWCYTHDAECRAIAEQGRKLWAVHNDRVHIVSSVARVLARPAPPPLSCGVVAHNRFHHRKRKRRG